MPSEFRCPVCQQEFTEPGSRLAHLQVCVQIHLRLPHREVPPEPRMRRRVHACPNCHEVFVSKSCLDRHRQLSCPLAEPISLDRYRVAQRRDHESTANPSVVSGDP